MKEHLNKGIFKSYYDKSLSENQDGPKAVGYRDEVAQQRRFEQLVKLFEPNTAPVVNDLGCGLGGFYQYMKDHGWNTSNYKGFDILEEMTSRAAALFPEAANRFVKIEDAGQMTEADYTIASGVFNLKGDQNNESWKEYILQSLSEINERSRKGFAFNILTKYSDKERMEDQLYYADPSLLFDHCKQHFSRNVALLHDYDEYDFTILVRK